MRFGADYYPEHWPEERWETDARMMKEIGFDTTRLAEFSWVKLEPEPGRFEFDWLLKALDILSKQGIQAVIGTPTATPPAWLCTSKPEMMRVDENEHRVRFGNRQQSCINHPDYHSATDVIVTKMAEVLGKHPGVLGWQIDNEFGFLCYCEVCQQKFQEWLKNKYKTLEALEEAWGTIFWSQTYTDWNQIPLPWKTSGIPNPSLALDYRRFFTDSYAAYQQRQIDIIRKHSDKPITHNFMGTFVENINYQPLADQLDWISWDVYPFGKVDPALIGHSHDAMRGYQKKNFWIMEQMSGPGGWETIWGTPLPGQVREWTYDSVGHGADAIVYFRWRVCRSGTEQYWHGILNHDASKSRRYDEIKQTVSELRSIESVLDKTTITPEVAVINDWDSRFAFIYQKSGRDLSYETAQVDFYKWFSDRNIQADVLTKHWDLSQYKVVVAPAHFVLKEDQAKHYREYVENGGTLVMTYRSAVKDKTSLIFNEPLPGLLQDVFGIRVKDYAVPEEGQVNTLKGITGAVDGKESEMKVWIDLLELNGAEAIAECVKGYIPGQTVISKNSFGKGTAYYVGTRLDDEFSNLLGEMVLSDAGVKPGPVTPEGVEALIRTGEKSVVILINHTGEPQQVQKPEGFDWDAFKKAPAGDVIELEAYGVAVLCTGEVS